MRPVEQKKKDVIASVGKIYDHFCVFQVCKKGLYKKLDSYKRKGTNVVGMYCGDIYCGDIYIKRGMCISDFMEVLAHEIGHSLVLYYKIAFPNLQTEEAWASYFTHMVLSGDPSSALWKTKRYQRHPAIVKSYGIRKYKTHWKLIKEFVTVIEKSKRYKMFRKVMREAYAQISG